MVRKVPSTASERPFTILAQDPSFADSRGNVLTAQVMVPAECLSPGPWGYRVQVIDYDSSTGELYSPWDGDGEVSKTGLFVDPYENKKRSLLNDPRFHSQNVYAIAMRILARFEFALGRRVEWSFGSHQLKISPHAFNGANAYYARDTESLQFGYFQGADDYVFSCLSHDVVAHETTHAVLDGILPQLMAPSTPDQAAFHEAFSDLVALLSVFSLTEIVSHLLGEGQKESDHGVPTILKSDVTIRKLRKSVLFGLAEQMGGEMRSVRGRPLRQSLLLEPSPDYLDTFEFQQPHRRGEILVAAVLNAFLHVLDSRLRGLDGGGSGIYDLERVTEEASKSADHLLTIAIRALDYCLPVHMTFSDYLSALLTADAELVSNDTSYGYREQLRLSFADYGIEPASVVDGLEAGLWEPTSLRSQNLDYGKSYFRSMQHDTQEIFRFLWVNQEQMQLSKDVYTRVLSVRPCMRVSPEGFPLHETIVHFMQVADIPAKELSRFKAKRPKVDGALMPPSTPVTLQGGGTLVFDQFGRLKYHITCPIKSETQSRRVDYLWRHGHFREDYQPASSRDLGGVHRIRSLNPPQTQSSSEEAWI